MTAKSGAGANFFATSSYNKKERQFNMAKEATNEDQRTNRKLFIWFIIAVLIALIPWFVVGATV